MTPNPKRPKPLRDPRYLRAVAEMPCILTGRTPSEPAHIRYGIFVSGQKPGDDRVLPLAPELHRLQHSIGEVLFWQTRITPEIIMEALLALAREHYAIWKELNLDHR